MPAGSSRPPATLVCCSKASTPDITPALVVGGFREVALVQIGSGAIRVLVQMVFLSSRFWCKLVLVQVGFGARRFWCK